MGKLSIGQAVAAELGHTDAHGHGHGHIHRRKRAVSSPTFVEPATWVMHILLNYFSFSV